MRAARGGKTVENQSSKVNVSVNYHHVRHVGYLGHFLQVLRVGHLHIIEHAQRYCFLIYLILTVS